MQVKLTIGERLKDLRVERKLTLEQLSNEVGISKSALGKYESDNGKDISPYSILLLADYYGVSCDYLMGRTETKNHPNTALHELHLSDASIDVLRTGKFNHRLLSELICHKDFQRFMLDAEIFVAPPFPTKSLILRGAPSASRILLFKNPAFVSPWCHKIRLSYCRRKVSVNRYLPVKQMAKPAPFLRQPEAKE